MPVGVCRRRCGGRRALTGLSAYDRASDLVPGLEPGRVAQLRVLLERGERRGSGYRVTDTVVLTAAHVVADARSVEVVFNADLDDQWTVPGTVSLCASAADVALVIIDRT